MSIASKLLELKQHQGFMRYFKNTSWLFAEKILRMVVGLFVGIWVARYLGPEKFGLFSYAQSFVGLFAVIATLGLDGIVIRELVKDESRIDELIGTAFFLKLMGAVVVLFILAIAVGCTSNDNITNTLIFIIASATLFQSFNVIDFYFQSKVMSRYVVYINTISLFISSFIKVSLILANASLVAFAWVVLFDSFVLAVGLIYFYVKMYFSLEGNKLVFNKVTAVSLLNDSWPLLVGGMSFVIFSNIDTLMIKELMSEYSVGIYTAAYKLVTLWYFLPGLVLGSLLPSLINVSDNSCLFNKRIKRISTLLIWISIIISVGYWLFGKYIISFTYGNEYSESSGILGLLSVVNVLIFYNSLFNQWMMIENKTRRILCFHAFTAVFNIILNYLLINIYGLVGAVYALLFSLILTYIIFSIFDKRVYQIFISSLLFKVLWEKDEKNN